MMKVYTSVDLGSDSVKVIVSEIVNRKIQVLASSVVRSVGIKKGRIIDVEMASKSLHLAINEISNKLGLKIDKALLTLPTYDIKTVVIDEEMEINKTIDGNDVVKIMQRALYNRVGENEELVMISPIGFTLDNRETVKRPIGRPCDIFSVKAVIVKTEKEQLKDYYEVLNKCGVEIVDLTFDIVGDYYAVNNESIDSKVGAIINIGGDKTTVGIFNKGILIKSSIIGMGSQNVDNDISYIFKLDKTTSRNLKETFAMANKRYADKFEVLEIDSKLHEKLVLNQYELSEVIEARLEEILKLAKNEINLLTKREIGYIIVTGGISELTGFQYLLDNTLGHRSSVLSMMTLGVRHNKFSASLGICQYFEQKLELKNINYTMFSKEVIENMIINNRSTTTSKTLVEIPGISGIAGKASKVFNNLVGNKED